MFGKLGGVIAVAVALGMAAPAFADTAPPPPSLVAPTDTAAPPPAAPTGPATRVSLALRTDGTLRVVEQLSLPSGQTATRSVPLRFAVDGETDRLFTITDTAVRGHGTASADGDRFTVTVTGSAVVTYVVHGAVVTVGDHEEVRWQAVSDWNVAFRTASVSFVGPVGGLSYTCLAGPVGSTTPCTSMSHDEGSVMRGTQAGLAQGDRMDLAVRLPAHTVVANAVAVRTSPFALTLASGAGLVGAAVLLILLAGLLWLLRGRDARIAAGAPERVDVLTRTPDGHLVFGSPDGVLPGQAGTVIDERVDLVDVAATVVDLAVRRYLTIEETTTRDGAPDWMLVRNHPPDTALTDYERALVDALLPDGTDRALLSELATRRPDLTGVWRAMYADVVARGWFVRRPDTDRHHWWWAGAGLAALGAIATAVLALTVGNALIGVGVVLGGIALMVVSRWMPARTPRGALLARHLHGLMHYVGTTAAPDLPASDAPGVFSRALPYAIALGRTEQWLTGFAGSPLPCPEWYVIGGTPARPQPGAVLTRTAGIAEFAHRFPACLAALHGILRG